jgi:hypothetical protein
MGEMDPNRMIWHDISQWAMASSFTRCLDQTQRRTTVGRTSLDEWSARRTDYTQHSQQTNIHASCGIRTKISASDRPKTYALDSVATGTGDVSFWKR